VIDQVKFEQLEKSGTVTEEAVTAGVDVPCTTHVPRSDGADDFEGVAPEVVVGPSTVEVRSALHAEAAAIAATIELNRKRDLFMAIFDIGRYACRRYLQNYKIVPRPAVIVGNDGQPLEFQLAIAERRPTSVTKLATVAVESTAPSSNRCCG
jgi:hypothetical protein